MREPLVHDLSTASPAPVEAFERLASLPFVLFLDSAASDKTHGRYSYLTAQPAEVLIGRGDEIEILERDGTVLSESSYRRGDRWKADPFSALAERLAGRATPAVDGLPPFQGGAAGLFGYGLGRVIERLPGSRHDEFRVPDMAVGVYDWVLAFDNAKGSCHLLVHATPGSGGDELRDRAAEIEKLLAAPAAAIRERPPHPANGNFLPPSELAPAWPLDDTGLLSNFERSAYLECVSRAIEYIHAGDVFQVNVSQRLLHRSTLHPLETYLRLRRSNPAAFAGYFDLGDIVVASSSPEQFLSVAGDEVITRPIKGTRSRGYTPEEDSFRRLDLRQSEKDKAENVMIVDLLRNDLSRVCRPHSVSVPRLFDLEYHPTVHHLVSEVRGRLAEGRGALDLLRASFPGGSVTGAPKVRAMEIIAELEPTARGAYCGSLGWIAFHGGMGTNILIRTMTLGRGWLQFPVGGGIVADSDPLEEYRETLDKAAGMVAALK